jgi:pilus assembly protein CpaF
MFNILISEKGGQPSKLEFRKGEISIGRMKGNDIVLPKGNVSKRHATIYLRDSSLFVNDHGSTNGTYVNGRRVEGEFNISEADKVYIGDFILQVDLDVSSAGPPQPPGVVPTAGGAIGGGHAMDNDRQGFETLFDKGAQHEGGDDPLRATFQSPPSGLGFGSSPAPGYDPLRQTMNDVDMNAAAPPPEQQPPRAYDMAGTSGAPSVGGARATPPPSTPAQTAFPTSGAPPQPTPSPQQPAPHPAPPSRPAAAPPAVQPPARTGGGVGHAVAAPVAAPQVVSEFDAALYRAQIDVARVIADMTPVAEIPPYFPLSPEDTARYEGIVRQAIDRINPSVDRSALERVLRAECVGLGALDEYLEDERVRDIYVNRFDQVMVRRTDGLFQARHAFSSREMLELTARRLLGDDADVLGADEIRFGDGTRVHVVMPPLAVHGPLITARKPPREHPALTDLISQGVLSPGMGDFLMRAVDAGRSIVVAGPTSSGKSTLLSSLGALIPEGMRVVSIEDYSHVALPQSSAVRLEASPSAGFDKRFLIRNALSMHPQRILLDECRGAETYDWVTSVASGTEGSMATIHGTSASDALGRLESLCLLGSADLGPRGLREQIARAVNLVVVVNRTGQGASKVHQITEVQGVDLDSFRLNDVFYHRIEGGAAEFHPTGYIPMFYEDLRNAGVNVDFDIFRE